MLEILISINTFSSSGTITLWLHHPWVAGYLSFICPENAKVDTLLSHSVLHERIASGSRNSFQLIEKR
jgi:hypothetical protein